MTKFFGRRFPRVARLNNDSSTLPSESSAITLRCGRRQSQAGRHADGAAHHADQQIAFMFRQVRPLDALAALRSDHQLIAHLGGEQFETFVTDHTENSPAKSSA